LFLDVFDAEHAAVHHVFVVFQQRVGLRRNTYCVRLET
jgi:hypothetical protein